MRLGQKVKGFFSRIGKGIKKGAHWLYNNGRKVINKVTEYAPKVIDGAKRVLNVLPSNKYTDGAKKVVDGAERAYEKGKQVRDSIRSAGS